MKKNELLYEILGDLNLNVFDLKVFLKSFFFNNSFRLLYNHRLTKYFLSKRNIIFILIGIYLKKKQIYKYNCQISEKAIIGKNLIFPHPLSIVIGEGVKIMDNVKIWQNVTLGSTGKIDHNMEYPIVLENVRIYAGAKIIGNIIIGENSIIGANAVVLKSVPKNCIAIGVPARIMDKHE